MKKTTFQRKKLNFSVLISMYHKEAADFFDRAMHSIWNEQTIKPNEIVLVEDGVLTDALYEKIGFWKEKLGEILTIVKLEKNVGLGNALNEGMKYCSYELIARMDTDDIALPKRFEKQLEVFKDRDIDICSGWIGEFDRDENDIISYRKLPELDEEIKKFAKKRSPINHPAVMYKKSVVLQAGGYKKMIWFEDYYLWARMILNDAKFYNLQETLVSMRAGDSQLSRRGGLTYALAELKFLKELYKIDFFNSFEFLLASSIRFIVRILPKFLLRLIYKKLR